MNLRQLPNAVVRTVVEFRGNLKDNMERANAGFPVVITKNDAVESVLISPDMAQRLFELPTTPPQLDPEAIDTEELVTEFEVEVEDDEEEVQVAPPTLVADAVGIDLVPPVLPESSPVDESPSVAEASAEVADATPADASEDDLGQCPACMGEGEDHVVPSNQHRTESDIPEDAEIVSDTESEAHIEEEAPDTTPAETPAEEATETVAEPVHCEVNVVANIDLCLRDAVNVVHYKDQTFSICQHHLDQLKNSGQEYEIVETEPSV